MNDDEYQSLMNRTSAAISHHERQIKALRAEQEEAWLARFPRMTRPIIAGCKCVGCMQVIKELPE